MLLKWFAYAFWIDQDQDHFGSCKKWIGPDALVADL